MLLKNLTLNKQSVGRVSIEPGQWACVPSSVAKVWGTDERFRLAPPCNPDTSKWDIVIVSGCPMDTTGGGQQPPQIARELEAEGHRVVFLQVIPQESPSENLIVIEDHRLFKMEAASLEEEEQFRNLLNSFSSGPKRAVLFTFPSKYCASLVHASNASGYKTIYWCLDDWLSINQSMGKTRFKQEFEDEVSVKCDYLISTADCLSEKIGRITGRKCTTIPNGFKPEAFHPGEAAPPIPADMKKGEKTLVFWGELGGKWIDWEVISRLATDNPTWQINLIGPDHAPRTRPTHANINYIKEKKVSELWAYGRHADYGLIPFVPGKISKAVNPIKAYEYLASGLIVVGSNMPELKKFPGTLIYRNYKELLTLLQGSNRLPANTSDFLKRSTWNGRAKTFLELIECPYPSHPQQTS